MRNKFKKLKTFIFPLFFTKSYFKHIKTIEDNFHGFALIRVILLLNDNHLLHMEEWNLITLRIERVRKLGANLQHRGYTKRSFAALKQKQDKTKHETETPSIWKKRGKIDLQKMHPFVSHIMWKNWQEAQQPAINRH